MAKSTLDLQSTEGMTNEAGLKLEILIIGRWNRWPMSGSNFNLSKSGTIQWRIYSSDLLFRCCVERLRPDSRWLVNTSFPGYSIRRWMSVIGHFQLRRSVINVNPSCGRHFFLRSMCCENCQLFVDESKADVTSDPVLFRYLLVTVMSST